MILDAGLHACSLYAEVLFAGKPLDNALVSRVDPEAGWAEIICTVEIGGQTKFLFSFSDDGSETSSRGRLRGPWSVRPQEGAPDWAVRDLDLMARGEDPEHFFSRPPDPPELRIGGQVVRWVSWNAGFETSNRTYLKPLPDDHWIEVWIEFEGKPPFDPFSDYYQEVEFSHAGVRYYAEKAICIAAEVESYRRYGQGTSRMRIKFSGLVRMETEKED